MTPLFKKLNLKNQLTIHILNAPTSFKKESDTMSAAVAVQSAIRGKQTIEFCLVFVTKQNEVDNYAQRVAWLLVDDGILWFAYPKGTSKKYTCEFNRDSGWNPLGKLGFEPVHQVAIDEDWSALRFRRVEHIKKMTRSFAMTESGKKKAQAANKAVAKRSTE
jgi:hypothetical protein